MGEDKQFGDEEPLRIALACGGTGGHIFPGLATAEELIERGHQVDLWLAGKDVEDEAVEGWEGRVFTVPAEGFFGGASAKSIGTAWKLASAAKRCIKLMQSNQPEVLLGMGSYSSVGPVCAAMRLKVPFVLHEANVLPGRAVSLFSRWAASVAASFEETRYYLHRKDLVLTGMPLRRGLAQAASNQPQGQPDPNHLTILVMGGSRGARTLNRLVPKAICEAYRLGHKIQVVHLSGKDEKESVLAAYDEAGVPGVVYSFTKDMAKIYAKCDLAICRSGAATCTELSAFGVPALLVPYPYAANDHQTINARSLEKLGAADVVPEQDLSVDWLKDYIAQSIVDTDRLARMSEATMGRSAGRAAGALADLVEKVGFRKSQKDLPGLT